MDREAANKTSWITLIVGELLNYLGAYFKLKILIPISGILILILYRGRRIWKGIRN